MRVLTRACGWRRSTTDDERRLEALVEQGMLFPRPHGGVTRALPL